MPEEFKCPIGLDKIHCPSCFFSKEGLCDHPHYLGEKLMTDKPSDEKLDEYLAGIPKRLI